ncbi:ubiquitin-like protein Pup [Buchananella hordeovulneris]|uniref:Prokaryotic ubiquitin-like protein Pup n=1 Tax=Buchananella hordeovulneris TaxID=52770 RepID=A0A1Q5PXH4_9ACTO|nr:ubiquitin-like protein Pup [Buchananella hordeovulneris]OKL52314.1 ubiquitin-like protein Pup [Buchananella hordeovulneris]RRD45496.1 ubiquitin-like protein Pup [Buchananella hordeovulneris]
MNRQVPRQAAGQEEQELAPPLPAPAAQVADVDALLDDIDAVLAADAETFVQGFVQKGGQ